MTTYTSEQVINALMIEFKQLVEDGYPPEISEDQYLTWLKTLTYEQLITETATDDEFLTLEIFMGAHN